jgi:hypothetical protein
VLSLRSQWASYEAAIPQLEQKLVQRTTCSRPSLVAAGSRAQMLSTLRARRTTRHLHGVPTRDAFAVVSAKLRPDNESRHE